MSGGVAGAGTWMREDVFSMLVKPGKNIFEHQNEVVCSLPRSLLPKVGYMHKCGHNLLIPLI